jgi:serine protease Do
VTRRAAGLSSMPEPPRRIKANGSGFIIDPTGIIVTNRHVIEGALAIFVTFSDGNRLPGSLIGFAPMIDLAVVKVNAGRPLPVLAWGDSNAVRVGDPVLTIGNPLGIGMSVAAGIVSALNRDIQDTPFDSYIQTDAALNHGNSVGPMAMPSAPHKASHCTAGQHGRGSRDGSGCVPLSAGRHALVGAGSRRALRRRRLMP